MDNKDHTHISGFWTFFLDRFKTTLLLVFFILIWGVVALINIPRENAPDIEIGIGIVSTAWPGATPEDTEKFITNKIEKEIKNLENVKQYSSTSMAGFSSIVVEFDVGSNNDKNFQNLREKVDRVKNELPSGLPDDPNVTEASITDVPVVTLALSGDYSWSELRQFAESIEDEMESITGVKQVDIKGAPEDIVHILLDPYKMEASNLGVNEVISAIRNAHRDTPMGRIEMNGQFIDVAARAEMERAEEFLEVPVAERGGVTIRLQDIATVRREFDDFEIETFFSTGEGAEPAVSLDVVKKGGQSDVIAIVKEVSSRLEEMQQKGILPPELSIDTTSDGASDIRESLQTLISNSWQTLLIIFILMWIALGFREAILSGIAIPLSFLITVGLLDSMGLTFNFISLFAMVLALGLLVDNAIIIVEGLSASIYEKKMSPDKAARESIGTYRWPVIAGTMTTVFAFLPMLLFITGINGEYISVLPITVIIMLVASLIVSLFLLPPLGAKFFQAFPPKAHHEGRGIRWLKQAYTAFIDPILSSGWKAYLVTIFSVLVMIGSFNLPTKTEIFPADDQTFFAAKFEFPTGTKLEETRKLVPDIEGVLNPFFAPRGDEGEIWLENYVITVGKESDAIADAGGSANQPEEHVLGLTVNLTPKEDRETASFEIVPLIREQIEQSMPAHVEVTFSEVQSGPPGGSPIEIRLAGDDFERLEEISTGIKEQLETMKGLQNVRDSAADRVPELRWSFDRDKLSKFGLTPASVANDLRTSVFGITVLQLTEGDEEVDVDIRIDWAGNKQWENPTSLEALSRIPVRTSSGDFIYLSQIASGEMTSQLSSISHRDGQRVIFVRADLAPGAVLSTFTSKLEEIVANLDLLPGESASLGGENEDANRMVMEMGISMAFALLLILCVLVMQFNSFHQAFVILAIIPFSLTAVWIGFWLSDTPLSFPTMIGIVSLAGIIVNDAIVLISRINENQQGGMDRVEAFVDAGASRLQPILLTSLTTVFGLMPLALSDPTWGSLGFAVIYGMAFSTVLTLVLGPCLLITVQDFGRGTKRFLRFLFT